MSKNAPKRKPAPGGKGIQQPQKPISWPLIIVWTISMVFVWQSCNKPAQTGPIVSLAENSQKVHDLAASPILHEGQANSAFKTLVAQIGDQEKALDDQVQKGKLSKADATSQKHSLDGILIDNAIVVTDNFIRAGVYERSKGDTGAAFDRLQIGYQLISGYQSKYQDSDLWQQSSTVIDNDGAKTQYTGDTIYKRSITELSTQNKITPVFGMIPGYQLVDFLVHITGASPGFSYWFAALLMAIVVRGIIWPLSQKQLMWGRQMSQLAPMMREIKEQFKNDQALQQKKMMELYSEYGLHPLAGCWPALVQLPLFLAVYQCMLHYRFEFQKGTFLWINEHTSHATHGFTAPNLGQKDIILILIYAVTLLISTLLTPVNDPTQVRQQRTIGIGVSLLFPFMMLTGAYPVPCAFVLYWTFTNVLATAQSLRAYYMLPSPPLVKVNTSVGGVLPTERKKSWFEKMQEQAQAQLELKQQQTEMQAKKIRGDADVEPPKSVKPSNGKPTNTPNPPTGGKQKPKRRAP